MEVLDRIADKFTIGDGCWEWTAGKNLGYGQHFFGGKPYLAHRTLFELFSGPIPAGHHVHHECRNRGCVRPDHFRAVTPSEHFKEHGPESQNVRKSHWFLGHELTPENTYM